MSGSVSIVGQLLAAGLLDELHLLVHPIAVRKGICTSSTSQPDQLPPAPTTTQRGTCPSLLTTDIPPRPGDRPTARSALAKASYWPRG
jgi:hypothetical protein